VGLRIPIGDLQEEWRSFSLMMLSTVKRVCRLSDCFWG
jgi:hypothetical protein